MKKVILPLINRARKWGYIIWKKTDEDNIKSLIGGKKNIEVLVNEKSIGNKSIDWKYRRIGITYTLTRALPKTVTKIELSIDAYHRLNVKFL
jgi:hypothetical protein